MDVKEIKKRKAALAAFILKALKNFEENTGVAVTDVDLWRIGTTAVGDDEEKSVLNEIIIGVKL